MNEENDRNVELERLVKGKSVYSGSSAKTPFWKEVICFITGDVTIEETTANLNREREIFDLRKTREVPPNITKTAK